MPNGFVGKRAEWARLEEPLVRLDTRILAFAQGYRFQVSKNQHNHPGRSIEWTAGNIRRIIQIYLEDPAKLTFNVWVCAFRDTNGSRYLKKAFIAEHKICSEIEEQLDNMLRGGKEKVESWSDADLDKVS